MPTAQGVERDDFVSQLTGLWDEDRVAVAVIDLDDFAGINESYGRDVGDAVIDLASRTLRNSLPDDSLFARTGGDEFACAIPGASPEEALIVLDEIRRHLSERRHDVGGHRLTVPLSAGIAAYPQHAEEPVRLVRAAEEALLRAKQGRTKVAIYVEDRMVLKSNYYPRAQLARLSALAETLGRTEASLLREGLQDVLDRHRDKI